MKKSIFRIGKRLLSLVLCLALLAACMPAIYLPTKAAANDNTTVDPHTLDQWQNYFGTMAPNSNNVLLTTEYAGGVWTDKSVFDPDTVPSQLTAATYNGNGFPLTDTGDNFLISLSAMASNKQIKGYSTIPTDTVFVLDLSSSMRYTDNNGQSAVDELVTATNKAITDLLALNKNNRIAVVVYAGNVNKQFNSGEGITQIVLPLDSYTTTQAGTYLQIDPLTVTQRVNGRWQEVPNSNPYGLAVYDGVSSASSGTGFRSNEFEVSTGTYMQDGIYEAMKLLMNADPVVQEGVQAGTDRLPIMVLMTDGEPTMANPDYNGNDNRTDLGPSSMNNYNGSTGGIGHRDTIAFMTSLTMAFAKKNLSSHYGEAPLFYTLAYGDAVLSRPEALSVLNPAQASTIQNNLWNRFLNGENVAVYSNNTTVKNSSDSAEQLTSTDRLYVDKYFPANTDEAMSGAFQDIVNEIILQSKYHPTYIQTDPNHDGYLTFVDKIGEYMEVTQIKGIIIGDRLFSGAALASQFNAGNLGTIENPQPLAASYVNSVKQRLGITDTAVARALLNSAYNNGQLYYNSPTDFDHYIGWYAKADGSDFQFLDAWYEGSEVPAGATHIVKSYGFMGDTTVVPGVANTDMMYMTVRVSTEISTGNTIVTWKIPASLVPTLTYEVDVEVDSDGNITNVIGLDTEMNTAQSPIRLVYEVALRKDIYDWNLTEKVDPNYTTYKDPGYVFYSNKWSNDQESTTRNTYSHFEPSVENERYYYTQDTQVLTDDQGTVYTGAKPSGTGYYHSLQVYEKLTNGSLRAHTHYEPISAEALDNAVSDGNGGWVIPKGTVHRYYDYEITDKEENPTNTMGHSDHPFVVKEGEIYYTYSTQGNNGKLVMTPATGIKLTKSLTDGFTSNETFTFVITGNLSGAQVVRLTDEGLEASRTAIPANGEVTLHAGETVYIIGLSAGDYTVSEKIAQGAAYQVDTVKVDNQSISGKVATVTLTNQDITAVEFTNGERDYGDLIISKDVNHPFTNVPAALTAQSFTIHVALTGEDVANTAFNITGNAQSIIGTTSLTTDADGKFAPIVLRDGEFVNIHGLPEHTTYTVTETGLPAGYRLDTANSVLSGTIDADVPAQGHVVNVYEPAQAPDSLVVTGTKTVDDTHGVPYDWTNKSFSFKLERYNPTDGTYTQIGQTQTITANGGSYSFGPLTFDTLGTYYYKVSEVIPALGDREDYMSYDATAGRFVVHVTDDNVDGVLEINVQDVDTGVSFAATSNVITYTKNFVNVYEEDYKPTFVEFEVDKDIRDPHHTGITAAGFLFGLYKVEGGVTATTPSYTVRTTGDEGKALFHIPYYGPANETYILKEIIPADADKIPGMVYDTTEYTVNISVTYDSTGVENRLTIQKDGQGNYQTPVFTNTMELNPTGCQFEVEKVMNGAPITPEAFTFTLTETDGSFVTPKAGVSDTVTITGAGTELFDWIEYTAVGTHYYVVKETAGTRGGMTYDATEYHITVDVTVNGNNLVATTSVVKLGEGAVNDIVFTNSYAVSGETSVTIAGTKTLTGRPLLNGEFSFLLTQVADANGTPMANPYTQTVHNGPAVNGVAAVTFAPITFTAVGTYYYAITEVEGATNTGIGYDNSKYIVTVVVSDNDNGGLTASWSIGSSTTFNFRNTYTPAAGETVLTGGKNLTGRVLKNGEFQFELYETGDTFSIAGITPKQTKENDVHGVISFDTLTYTAEGTYYYVVKETAGTKGGVTYDDTVYHVTVRVVDNHKGKLETFTSIDEVLPDGTKFAVSSIVFYNEYKAADTFVEFTVKKTISGLNDPSGFTFGLYRDLNSQPIMTVVSDADGVVTFEKIPYTMDQLDEGPFTYYIKELNDNQAGITYDDTIYTVVVTLTDDGEGHLTAQYTVNDAEVDETTYQFNFRNVFTPADIQVQLDIQKVMKVLSGGTQSVEGYKFRIMDGNGNEVAVVTSDAAGKAVCNIAFTAQDIGNTYTYTVTEVNTKVTGVTYSTALYVVGVTISQNSQGDLAPTITLDGKTVDKVELTFVNTYEQSETPQTGDSFSFVLWIGLLVAGMAGMVSMVVLKKRRGVTE